MRALNIARFVVFLAVVAVLLWFIDRDNTSAPEDKAAKQSPSAPVASSPTTPSPTPTAPSTSIPPESGPPRNNPVTRKAARVQAAERAAGAFARPTASATRADWWSALAPMIADRYCSDFDYIDPQQVPYTRVTGRGRVELTPAPETLLTMVRVPTNAGDYAVEVEDLEDGPRVLAIYPWQNE